MDHNYTAVPVSSYKNTIQVRPQSDPIELLFNLKWNQIQTLIQENALEFVVYDTIFLVNEEIGYVTPVHRNGKT